MKYFEMFTASVLCVGFALPVTSTAADDVDEALREAQERLVEFTGGGFVIHDGEGRDIVRMFGGGERAMIGINLAPQDSEDRDDDGVYVAGVTPGGPAAAAGLESGDLIISIDEMPLNEKDGRSPETWLVEYMDALEPGDEVEVTYRRGDDEVTVTLTTEALRPRAFAWSMDGDGMRELEREFRRFGDRMPEMRGRMPRFDFMFGGHWSDMELVDLSERLGEYFGTDQGVLVVRAPSDESLGLQDGDVIVSIGGREIQDPGHAMRILRSYRAGEELEMDIYRDRDRDQVSVTVPGDPEGDGRRRGD